MEGQWWGRLTTSPMMRRPELSYSCSSTSLGWKKNRFVLIFGMIKYPFLSLPSIVWIQYLLSAGWKWGNGSAEGFELSRTLAKASRSPNWPCQVISLFDGDFLHRKHFICNQDPFFPLSIFTLSWYFNQIFQQLVSSETDEEKTVRESIQVWYGINSSWTTTQNPLLVLACISLRWISQIHF